MKLDCLTSATSSCWRAFDLALSRCLSSTTAAAKRISKTGFVKLGSCRRTIKDDCLDPWLDLGDLPGIQQKGLKCVTFRTPSRTPRSPCHSKPEGRQQSDHAAHVEATHFSDLERSKTFQIVSEVSFTWYHVARVTTSRPSLVGLVPLGNEATENHKDIFCHIQTLLAHLEAMF